jgi:hypothetical protein
VDPLQPNEPTHEENNGIFIGIGVAAAFVFLVVCAIAVTI